MEIGALKAKIEHYELEMSQQKQKFERKLKDKDSKITELK